MSDLPQDPPSSRPSYLSVPEDASVQVRERAVRYAAHVSLPVVLIPYNFPEDPELHLHYGEEGLSLRGNGLCYLGDLTGLRDRIVPSRIRSESLVRAAKIKDTEREWTAIDATAGLGEDSLLLAAAGFHVTMFEYNPFIAVLLEDSLARAASDPLLSPVVARMELRCGDSIAALPKFLPSPDVILLDPMFPERKKSALIKKKFQLLHRLEMPCANESQLLDAAIAAQPHKILVKRPQKGPLLDGRKPSYSIEGSAVRYDIYVFA